MIINICSGHYVYISVKAKLMDRTPQNLREKQLVPLIKQGKIDLPSHMLDALRDKAT